MARRDWSFPLVVVDIAGTGSGPEDWSRYVPLRRCNARFNCFLCFSSDETVASPAGSSDTLQDYHLRDMEHSLPTWWLGQHASSLRWRSPHVPALCLPRHQLFHLWQRRAPPFRTKAPAFLSSPPPFPSQETPPLHGQAPTCCRRRRGSLVRPQPSRPIRYRRRRIRR